MNYNQRQFVESKLENSKLLGIPGGGKTTTIIKKIIHHREKNELQNNNSFIIVTFSRKACNDFIKRGDEIEPGMFTTNNVKTIHSLSGTILSKAVDRRPISLDIVVAAANAQIQKLTTEQLKDIKCLSTLSLIIVDEAQDISDIQYQFVKLLAEKLSAKLILVGDPNQNIYQFQNGSDKYLMNHDGTTYMLTENYRSTPEIINLVNTLKPWKNTIPDIIPVKHSLNKKPIVYHGSISYLKKMVLEEITAYREAKKELSDIVIIGPVKKSGSNQNGSVRNLGLQNIVNLLEDTKIKYVRHYQESTGDCEVVNVETESKTDHVNLMTIHGSKGLEFKKVIVLNFHTNTFGRVPTLEDYNKFKYLWYVALSRAKEELVLCVDNTKNIWPEFKACNKDSYILVGKPLKFREPKFSEKPAITHSITELLKSKEIFREEDLLNLSDIIGFEEEISDLYDTSTVSELKIAASRTDLYGIYVEKYFEVKYCQHHSRYSPFLKQVNDFINCNIILNEEHNKSFISILGKLGKNITNLLNIQELHDIKNRFNSYEAKCYESIYEAWKKNKYGLFSVTIKNDQYWYDRDTLLEILNKVNTEDNLEYNLFLLCLFFHQMEHEGRYNWKNKEKIYTELEKSNIQEIFPKIQEIITKSENTFLFQKEVINKYIDEFYGIIDIYDPEANKIIEIKFVKQITLLHKLQVFFYTFGMDPTLEKNTMELWNFQTGKKHIIKVKEKFNPLEILFVLAKVLNKRIKNLTFIYDLETTGLIEKKDDKTIIYPEIIERYFYEPTLKAVLSNGYVKPTKKLPKIITEITNITESKLEKAQTHADFIRQIKLYIDHMHFPTFIAHNGHYFDHDILRYYGVFDDTPCNLVDSIALINHFCDLKNFTSRKLKDLYLHIFKEEPKKMHRAKSDVDNLLRIFNKFDILNKIN